MFHNLHPKCANPSCISAFDWVAGGKLFRFHREPRSTPKCDATGCKVNSHWIEHFWLCEHCSRIYTLGYEPEKGVFIRALWPELPAAEHKMLLPVP